MGGSMMGHGKAMAWTEHFTDLRLISNIYTKQGYLQEGSRGLRITTYPKNTNIKVWITTKVIAKG